MNAPSPGCSDAFEYDAFVAFCDADRVLAEEEVLRPLNTVDLRVVTRHQVKYGATKLDNIESNVKSSRHTLAIITRSYLGDEHCRLLEQIATHLDPAALKQRFIPLIFEALGDAETGAGLRLLIARLEPANFTDPQERDATMNRLLSQIGGERKQLNEKSANSARRGMALLHQFQDTPELRQHIDAFWEVFARTSAQIESLTHDKWLHDAFDITQDAYAPVLDRKRELFASFANAAITREEADDLWDGLEKAVEKLKANMTAATSLAEQFSGTAPLPRWVASIQKSEANLDEAFRIRNEAPPVSDDSEGEEKKREKQAVEKLKAGLAGFATVLQCEPTPLNESLKKKARDLPLPELIEKQNTILSELRGIEMDEERRKRADEFAVSVKATELIQQNLQRLVANHDALQAVNDELQLLDGEQAEMGRIRHAWRKVEAPLKNLQPARWIQKHKLKEAIAGLEAALEAHEAAAGAEAMERPVRRWMDKLRPAVRQGFSQTDHDLRELADEINKLRNVTDERLGAITHA